VTSRRKSRRFSRHQHVRLSGEDFRFFEDSPSAQHVLSLTHKSKQNTSSFDVIGDETPLAKTQAATSRVGKIRSRGFVRRIPTPEKQAKA
jgi:hypothetical protein